ncbi:DNRLRE domain-containing protein [Chloroflexota bacterium]
MPVYTIQPPDMDSYLYQFEPTNNFGSSTSLKVQTRNVENIRAVLQFSLAVLPPGGEITAAELQLYYYDKIADPVGRIYRANRLTRTNWVEDEVTWAIYKTGSSWTSPGGDFTAVDHADDTVPAGYGWMAWGVLAQVLYAQTNEIDVAFLIHDSSENQEQKAAHFASKEHATTTWRPKLIVTYTLATTPTVTTQAAEQVSWNSVKGHGTIVSNGGLTVTKRGFCYNTTGDPTVADDVKEETGDFENGAFSLLVDNLLPGTHYYLKAYAYNSEGYGYGATVEFDTKEAGQVPATLSSRFAGKAADITYAAMYAGGGDVQIHPPDYTNPDNLCGVDDTYTASPWLFRTFLFFNLEALAGLVFGAVRLKVWCYSSDPEFGNHFCITEGLQGDPVVLANWVPQNAVTTILGQKEQQDFVPSQYNEIVFNSDGLALVNSKLGSILKLCLRTQRDIDNDFWASLHDSVVHVFLPHESGKEPLLEFTMGRSQVQVIA